MRHDTTRHTCWACIRLVDETAESPCWACLPLSLANWVCRVEEVEAGPPREVSNGWLSYQCSLKSLAATRTARTTNT